MYRGSVVSVSVGRVPKELRIWLVWVCCCCLGFGIGIGGVRLLLGCLDLDLLDLDLEAAVAAAAGDWAPRGSSCLQGMVARWRGDFDLWLVR